MIEEEKNLQADTTVSDISENLIDDDKNKNIRRMVLDCKNGIDSFYGLYYSHYFSKTVLTIVRVLAICIALAVCCVLLPFTLKNNDNTILITFFLVFWSIFVVCVPFFVLKNRCMNMIYYKQNGKPVFIYWDKKYCIINYGQGKKFEYSVKLDSWEKYSEADIAPSDMFFGQIKSDIKLTQSGNRQRIDCYTREVKLNHKCKHKHASLLTQNGTPIFIECFVTRMMPMKRNGLQSVPRRIKRRIDFVELDTDKYCEIPKSLIDFCKKNKIEPPEESKFLHYTK